MDFSNILPLDSMSAAMTVAPKSIPVLSGIYKLATDIRETTERVEVNKQECEQLSERIDTLIGFLAQRDFSKCLNEALEKALDRFETFLQRCLDFISTFIETNWFKRIVNNKDHEKKFLDLNRELTQYSNDINFGIGLSNLSMNGKEDKDDPTDIRSSKQTGSRKNSPHPRSSEEIDDNHQHALPPQQKFHNRTVTRDGFYSYQQPKSIFTSGKWQYRYFQYNQWFGPFQHQLTFDPTAQTLNGYGEDDVGRYILSGSFSEVNGQLEMLQHYQLGTGNPSLNLGHQDVLRLSWNPTKKIFEGMAYSQVGCNYTPAAIIEMSPT